MKPLLPITEEDYHLINKIIRERNLKEGAIRRLRTPISKYLLYHKEENNKTTTMTQLIREAQEEQDNGINPQKTQLYTYLTQFRVYLNSDVSSSTLHNYMIIIKEVYRHHDILLPQLKPFKTRTPPQITYEDLPTKEEIQQACTMSTIDMRALILFQSSSGTSLHESLTITIGMFFKACEEYEKYDPKCNIERHIIKLQQHAEKIIPLLSLERVKTNKYYYTCCSHEATDSILQYLRLRLRQGEEVTIDSKVFPYPKGTYTKKYWSLNQRLGLGFVGKYSKFRSHALRKFHASNLGCGTEIIDELQGRGKNTVHEAYIKDRPQKIKQTYTEYMNNVLIFNTITDEIKITDTTETTVNIQTTEETLNNTHYVDKQIIFELIKTIGKLEQRIAQLEQRRTQKDEDNRTPR